MSGRTSSVRLASVEQLRRFVIEKEKAGKFQETRRYAHDFASDPETARVLVAMQVMALGAWPADMSTYHQARTGDRVLVDNESFAVFASLYCPGTRNTLLEYFNLSSERLGSVQCVSNFREPLSIVVGEGDRVVAQAARIQEGEEREWMRVVGGIVKAIDGYFSYAGRGLQLLNSTGNFLREGIPLIFSQESMRTHSWLRSYVS